jgi:aromatic-amino-acid transaminase
MLNNKDPFNYLSSTRLASDLVLPDYDAFDAIEEMPEGPIFGLKENIKKIEAADPRAKIFNLVVGVYRDERGQPYVFPAVAEAEKRIQAEKTKAGSFYSKEYFPIDGDPQYLQGLLEVIFGTNHALLKPEHRERIAAFGVMGGTGGLYLESEFFKRLEKASGKNVSFIYGDPTWSNHLGIFKKNAGFTDVSFEHVGEDGKASVGNLEVALQENESNNPNSIPMVLLHGVCHNPTGVDYDEDQIDQLVMMLKMYKAQVIVDTAYHGFGDGFERDGLLMRRLAEGGVSVIINYSLSKNGSEYQDRVGAAFGVFQNKKIAKAMQSVGKSDIIRRTWSNSAAHGQMVMRTIFTDSELRAQWANEDVKQARESLQKRRVAFADLLKGEPAERVRNGKGLFTIFGFTREQIALLSEPYLDERIGRNVHVIMPAAGNDRLGRGRLNAGGLTFKLSDLNNPDSPADLQILADRINAMSEAV